MMEHANKKRKIQSERKDGIDRSGWKWWFPYEHDWLNADVLDIVVDYDGRKFAESPSEYSEKHYMFVLDEDEPFVAVDHHNRGIRQREEIDEILIFRPL
jgi:hypothetical protein